ncbi:MAG: sigma-54-dependent Fis family transcriptional regulator [Planctomycetes bacterium]|nr:sigma-54-dependent Fis family transcriptional regulator [Planctomycetota bacterium]
MNPRILIVEDEQLIRWSLLKKLQAAGYEVSDACTGQAGLDAIGKTAFDLIMLDYKLPDMTGLEILRQVRESDSDVVVIMMTAYSTVESAVEAMKLGAYDYLTKPFNMDEVIRTVAKSLETTKLRREVRELRRHISHEYSITRVIGKDPSMTSLLETISRVAGSGASTIFLRGESGTGKDLIARVIHYNSDRAVRPFMNITCTAISENLLESELFGHEKGAFTDARNAKKGLFELADGGTIFLDEVGDMSPGLQAKLLRFLEERTFRRVGGTSEISVDVRIIAATNRDIEQAIKEGQFRSDLLFRLDVVAIDLPPLRDRGDDVNLLAQYYVDQFSKDFRKPIKVISESVYKKLRSYGWPGNVRELRNVIERAVLLSKNDCLAAGDIVLGRPAKLQDGGEFKLPPEGVDIKSLETSLIRQALAYAQDNQTQAAKLLGMSRDTFRYRLEKLGLV